MGLEKKDKASESSFKELGAHRSNTRDSPPHGASNSTANTTARASERRSSQMKSIPPFIIKASAIASLGGILFGYDMGVVSGALPQVAQEFDLSRSEQEAVVSFLFLGGGIGAAVGGSICDAAGRRCAILCTGVIFVIGAAILYFAPSLSYVLLGRIVVGFAVSLSGVADVAYLHEIGPSEWRGAIVSVNEACISFGFLLSYAAGYFLSEADPIHGWRTMFGASALIATVQFVGMLYMPESPIWLREKGRHREAEEALKMMEGTNVDESYYLHEPLSPLPSPSKRIGTSNDRAWTDAEKMKTDGTEIRVDQEAPGSAELSADPGSVASPVPMASTGDEGKATSSPDATSSVAPVSHHTPNYGTVFSESNSDGRSTAAPAGGSVQLGGAGISGNWHCLLVSNATCPFLRTLRTYYKQAIVAFFLTVVQQFCGHPNVLNFAPEIFAQVGMSSQREALGSTLLLGFVKFLTTCVVIWKIETIGRRFLLLFGMGAIAVSLVALTICYIGSTTEEEDGVTRVRSGTEYIAVAGVFGVAFGYAASFGPLTWLLTSELFPTSIRGRALGISTIVTYLSASLVSCTLLSGQELFGPAVPFAGYAMITALSVVFAYLAIPDTGGLSSDEINDLMSSMWIWKSRGNFGSFSHLSHQKNLLTNTAPDMCEANI